MTWCKRECISWNENYQNGTKVHFSELVSLAQCHADMMDEWPMSLCNWQWINVKVTRHWYINTRIRLAGVVTRPSFQVTTTTPKGNDYTYVYILHILHICLRIETNRMALLIFHSCEIDANQHESVITGPVEILKYILHSHTSTYPDFIFVWVRVSIVRTWHSIFKPTFLYSAYTYHLPSQQQYALFKISHCHISCLFNSTILCT